MSAPWQSIKLKPTTPNAKPSTLASAFEMPKLKPSGRKLVDTVEDYVVIEEIRPTPQSNLKETPQSMSNGMMQTEEELAVAIAKWPEDAFEH